VVKRRESQSPLAGKRERGEKRPSTDEVFRWLDEVPDPEIPVLSVTDLGIVRAVEWRDEDLVVMVTPTYSGCPATAVIALSIEEALRVRGVERVSIKTQLSPAWTTDFMRESAREKLRAFGIAPPACGARCVGDLKNPVVECPRCGSAATEQVSRFGSTPCKAHWRCRDCLEPFDYFKRF
jgi:ring-1,2-phenylacetyl-CoA epoxidase subunit PaaD